MLPPRIVGGLTVKCTSKVSGSGPSRTGCKTAIPKPVAEALNINVGSILIWEIEHGVLKVKKL